MPSLFEDEDNAQLSVNAAFALKYEEKKKSEELSNLRDKYGHLEHINAERLEQLASGVAFGEAAGEDLNEIDSESDSDSESGVDEDETGQLVTPEIDAQILRTIAAIRTRDPRCYDASSTFFDDAEMDRVRDDIRESARAGRSDAPITLKDYHRDLLLAGNADVGGLDDADVDQPIRTFADEQDDLKRSFQDAVREMDADLDVERKDLKDNEDISERCMDTSEKQVEKDNGKQCHDDVDDDKDNFFKLRKKTCEELVKEEMDYKKFLLESMAGSDQHSFDALKEWRTYEDNPNIDASEKFLLDFILNRGWMEKPIEKPYLEDIDLDADENAVEESEQFERKHNFRFEEENAASLITHARDLPGSLRRKDTRRQGARQRRDERKQEDRLRKVEDLKRLKNLKRNEIYQKLRKIQEITGNDVVGFEDMDFDQPFDAQDWDVQMSKVFNDSYYNADDPGMLVDAEEGVDLAKPVWKDDIDISDLVGANGETDNEYGEETADMNTKKKKKRGKKNKKEESKGAKTAMELIGYGYEDDEAYAPIADNSDAGGHDEFTGMDADYLNEIDLPSGMTTKRLSKRELKRAEKDMKKKVKNLDDYLGEYYQLDYEDMIGDTPTRFKYTTVPKEDFGLTPVEILLADDKDLNEFFSLKKLAPYRRQDLVEKDMRMFKRGGSGKLNELKAKAQQALQDLKKSNRDGDGDKEKKKKDKKDKKEFKAVKDSATASSSDAFATQELADADEKTKRKQEKKADQKRKRTEDKICTNDSSTAKPDKKRKKNEKITYMDTPRLASYGIIVKDAAHEKNLKKIRGIKERKEKRSEKARMT